MLLPRANTANSLCELMPKEQKRKPRLKKTTATPDSELTFLSGGGEMGGRMRDFDWASSPAGPAADWPESLKTAVSICIGSRYPIVIWWGRPAYTMFYNDGYIPVLGVTKHPGWLGRSGRECWKEIWSTVGPMLEGVFETGVATWSEDLLLVMDRNLPREEVYFTFSYSPIRGVDNVDGIFCACYETTARVIGERRLQTLRDLGRTVMEVKSAEQACEVAARTLEGNPHDVPFAAIYLLDDDSKNARLCASTRLEPDSAAAPGQIAITQTSDSAGWPLPRVFETVAPEIVSNPGERFGSLSGGAWPEATESALILPIAVPGYAKPAGFLIAGFSPRRIIDSDYRNFFDLIVGHLSTAIANARAYQEERRRAEALAEIDRSKTTFFSNVSHEFRTPLTLMLGPLEETLSEPDLSTTAHERLEIAHRNSIRLLKLVNTLLDFSRIEAGRIEAVYEPVDLSTFTAELASVFRSAAEKAGISFVVQCSPVNDTVYIDREMWEKIVFNLLSNALKFTFDGEIRVTLRECAGSVKLTVSDSGTGIPEAELPHLFERFHRVRGARGRSYEGSGIGLALVQELVKLHGGAVQVTSKVDQGSTFVVSVPTGTAHLPEDRLGRPRTLVSSSMRSEAYVEEVMQWLPQPQSTTMQSFSSAATESSVQPQEKDRARILLADDNADMREYVRRLLATKYDVEAAADGEAALELVRTREFDLVLTDVMMPRLDGFGLLRALRSDERTQTIPVILLSARAGEESRVEGMGAGADDYLVKPFSARELLARVEAHLNLQRVRAEADQAVRLRTAQFETLLNEAPVGVYLVDADFRLREVNPTALPVFGDMPDLVGSDFDEVIHRLWTKEYADEVVSIFRHTLETGEPYFAPERIEERIDRCTTEYYEWQVNRIPLPDGSHGVVCYFRDVSAQVLARLELKGLMISEQKARASAEVANRVKDDFLAVLSHELRTPLNAIVGWTHLLKKGKLSDGERQRGIDVIDRNAAAQREIIDELLDVSRIITGKLKLDPKPVDLAGVIDAAIEGVRPAADAKGVEIEMAIDREAGLISGEALRLQQVIWNLLSNAIKFTPANGRVKVESRVVGRDLEVTVSDTGEGIDDAFLPYIFDRFRQADSSSKRMHGGLGLGLSIVRSLVEMHGGRVSAESDGRGKGATFRLSFPVIALSQPEPATTNLRPQEQQSKDNHAGGAKDLDANLLAGLRVLTVDDQQDTRELIMLALTRFGAEVRTSNSALMALETIRDWQPDVIVSDIGLPEMDGYDLLRRLRESEASGKRIPAIAVTGYAGAIDESKAIKAGYELHFSKPIELNELATAIAKLSGKT
jgi:PAS domain S-box-containing protein